jgi:translation initiation factor 3 subunit D
VEFSRISKLQYDPEAPEVLASGGSVPFYNKTFDRVTTKSSKPIYVDDKSALAYLPLSKDPMVKKLASEIEGTVAFMSDAAAALLMATLRTVHPWDLVARHISPNAIIIDQREDLQASSFSIDQVLVSETANEPPTEDREAFNSAFNLALEASRIGNIMPSVICSNDLTLNLGSDLSAPSHCAYKYFKWTMGDGNFLVIRSLINAANRMGTTEEPVLIRSLLEFDSSRYGNNLDWRSKLDNQRGAILANEIKNNNSMIARWVFQAHLAQIDSIKLAYVSRVSPKDRVRHELLALQDIEPYELATQMNLDTANGFGILKALFDIIIQSQDSIAIIRDPVKPILRLYNL